MINHWHDWHYQIAGPAFAQMKSASTDDLLKTRSEVLLDENYFPELKPVGSSLAQVFKSSSGEGGESVRLKYLLSIAWASQTIALRASNFVPDELAIETLVAARQRGVKIEINVTGAGMDAQIVRRANHSLCFATTFPMRRSRHGRPSGPALK